MTTSLRECNPNVVFGQQTVSPLWWPGSVTNVLKSTFTFIIQSRFGESGARMRSGLPESDPDLQSKSKHQYRSWGVGVRELGWQEWRCFGGQEEGELGLGGVGPAWVI